MDYICSKCSSKHLSGGAGFVEDEIAFLFCYDCLQILEKMPYTEGTIRKFVGVTPMDWISIDEEPPAYDLEIIVCDLYGHMYFATRDEHGYYDHHCMLIPNVQWWAYKPEPPRPKPIITNDEWVNSFIRARKGNGMDQSY